MTTKDTMTRWRGGEASCSSVVIVAGFVGYAHEHPARLAFAPVKIGVLIDIDMGTKDDFLATLRFAFDEALRARRSSRARSSWW